MPPVFGPFIAVEDALVILCGDQRQDRLAVAECEEARLFAVQKLLEHDLGTRRRRRRAHHHVVDGGIGLGQTRCDHHALAGGEPIGLHDQGCAEFAREFLRRIRFVEALTARGRDPRRIADVFHEGFRAFELRAASASGPNDGDAGRRQAVDQARDQRRLGPDHDEIDLRSRGRRDDAVEVFAADRDAFGDLGDAPIAGRALETVAERGGGNFPAQRMLAPAAADDQNPH